MWFCGGAASVSHILEGPDVVFIEADLKGVVGTEGLHAFEGVIKAQQAHTREKDRHDEKARPCMEEREINCDDERACLSLRMMTIPDVSWFTFFVTSLT
jgi:hypothetical protein